ncbi:hypothetical protein PMAYCL1PPCAC_31465, partial [Pristionchus mayeri]
LHFVIAADICVLEICSLVMNFAAVRYCRWRCAELYGKSSLNARYQVKEAYELAVSMQRAYLITFVSKNLVDSIIMVGCIRGDEAHRCIPLLFPIPFSVVEGIYCMTSLFRFLLYVWGASYLSQFVSHASLCALNTTMTSLPTGKRDPALRDYFLGVSVFSQFFCECLEIMIATERILSSIRPAEYHLSGRSNRLLIPLTLLALLGAIIQGSFSLGEQEKEEI